MRDLLAASRQRVALLALCVAVFVMAAVPAVAGAAVDAKKLTEPIEAEVTSNLPVILAFIGTVFALSFIIGWLIKRARTAGK